MNEKQLRSLEMIAESIISGYSSLFTFAVRENLDADERRQVAEYIRTLANSNRK